MTNATDTRRLIYGPATFRGCVGVVIDVISGPLDQLELLASLIDAARDGFTLERDDAAVEAGMLRSIWPLRRPEPNTRPFTAQCHSRARRRATKASSFGL